MSFCFHAVRKSGSNVFAQATRQDQNDASLRVYYIYIYIYIYILFYLKIIYIVFNCIDVAITIFSNSSKLVLSSEKT